jgi:hypothetical protein
MTTTTSPLEGYPGSSPERVSALGPVFNVGLAEYSQGYVANGIRYFEYQTSPDDERLSALAGWGNFPQETVHEGIARLVLPSSMRSASSALGGVEAWQGEKIEIVDFVVTYAQQVHKQLDGRVDSNLLLDTIGVDKGNKTTVVVPPHKLSTSLIEVYDWLAAFQDDLTTVLGNDPAREELLGRFNHGMSFLRVRGEQ